MLEAAAQVLLGAVQTGLHGLRRNAEAGSGVLGTELLHRAQHEDGALCLRQGVDGGFQQVPDLTLRGGGFRADFCGRSEEHTFELQSLMRNSYAVFCLKKKKKNT